MRPMRNMIGARAVRVSQESTAMEALCAALPRHSLSSVRRAFERGDVVTDAGIVCAPEDFVAARSVLWTFAPIPDEPLEPIHLDVVSEGEGYLVVDKPHGLATMPRGSHVAQTVITAARRQCGNPDIVAAHRLDRETAGLILLIKHKRWRGAYQGLFEQGCVDKWYRAVAPWSGESEYSREAALRIHKERRELQARVQPVDAAHPANAFTTISLIHQARKCSESRLGVYSIQPHTGKTHQIRVTMCHLGIPIVGDPLYPTIRVAPDDAAVGARVPLQLLAARLRFGDPVENEPVDVTSRRRLELE